MAKQYQRKDHLYQKAKDEGYRSRAAYKLIELDKRFELLKRGSTVLDLGAWPGGWLQVAAERVAHSGTVVGIDLQMIDPLPEPWVRLLCGDARDEEMRRALRELAPRGYSTVLSDMSPKLTGIREADSVGTVACGELALFIAQAVLAEEGKLAIKLFKSNESEQFVKSMRSMFNTVKRVELDATRSSSNEFYVVGIGFKNSSGLIGS